MADHTHSRPPLVPPFSPAPAPKCADTSLGDPQTSVVVPRLCCCSIGRPCSLPADLCFISVILRLCAYFTIVCFYCDAVGDNARRRDGDGESSGHQSYGLFNSRDYGKRSGTATTTRVIRRLVLLL